MRRYVAWHREAYEVAPAEAPVALRAGAVDAVSPTRGRVPALARSAARFPVWRVLRDVGLVLLGVVAALIAGLAGSALLDGTVDVSHYAREHLFWTIVLLGVVAVTTVRAVGAWRRAVERA